ncbi:hypothetical protein CRG98_018518 [Punica granatum]|uniref:U-box domain-containing protein n=1 Tax=Punica granatum TaxID=22663 RepID=A0A2I0JZ31_PUNGR|nr:hypothetical protein CRG98_018518 [Punica granatum]
MGNNKKLYEAMFGRSNKSGAEDDEGENYRKSSGGSSFDFKETSTYSYETVKQMENYRKSSGGSSFDFKETSTYSYETVKQMENYRKSSGGSSFDFKETSTYSYETVKHMDQHSIATSAKRLEDEGFPLTAANDIGSPVKIIPLERTIYCSSSYDGDGSLAPHHVSHPKPTIRRPVGGFALDWRSQFMRSRSPGLTNPSSGGMVRRSLKLIAVSAQQIASFSGPQRLVLGSRALGDLRTMLSSPLRGSSKTSKRFRVLAEDLLAIQWIEDAEAPAGHWISKVQVPRIEDAEAPAGHWISKVQVPRCYTGVTNTDEGSSTIPQYLICPLTRPLFEDPVTLETGQTFERAAIQKWFDEGNKTCPVTGNSLECLSVPLANMVIKCVIDSWKSKHCKNILAFASQMMEEKEGREFAHSDDGFISILEQLITIYSREERIVNVKHLISLGSVQYLIRRFVLGTTEEKIRGAGHLICCIEADASCRDRIAKAINIQVLIEFLHSKQIEARTNAVPLLTELVCPKR